MVKWNTPLKEYRLFRLKLIRPFSMKDVLTSSNVSTTFRTQAKITSSEPAENRNFMWLQRAQLKHGTSFFLYVTCDRPRGKKDKVKKKQFTRDCDNSFWWIWQAISKHLKRKRNVVVLNSVQHNFVLFTITLIFNDVEKRNLGIYLDLCSSLLKKKKKTAAVKIYMYYKCNTKCIQINLTAE